MPTTVRAVAPCRADLAGGTLDIWPLGQLHPGAVTVNLAVPVMVDLTVTDDAPNGVVLHSVAGSSQPNRFTADDASHDLTAAVVFTLRPEGGVRIVVDQQAPMGSGLGGSSAYGIALASATATHQGHTMSEKQQVNLVKNLEARILSTPTGCQDHWGAVKGGVLAVHLEAQGERIEELDVDPEWIDERMTLFFSGITHNSGMVNWQVVRRRLDLEAKTTRSFDEIADAARACREALIQADSDAVAEALRREWAARKKLAPQVCPAELSAIEKAVVAHGAAGFKACGAGGGGSVLVWHEPQHRQTIVKTLETVAPEGRVLPRGVAELGCRTRAVIG